MRYYALKITGLIIIIFILQKIFHSYLPFFILSSEKVFIHPWTILTAIFLHGGLLHLMNNSFALALFGSILEKEIGGKRFLLLFFAGGITVNVISLFFYPSLIGASGAIFVILGALVVMKPKLMVFAMGVPMPMILAGFVWVITNMIGAAIPGNTAYISHLTGISLGFASGYFYRKEHHRRWKEDINTPQDDEMPRNN